MINLDENLAYDFLSFLTEIGDDEEKIIMDSERISWLKEDIEIYPELGKFSDYTITYILKGEHHTDGTVVEYVFKFTSPDGVITKIKVNRNLITGWMLNGEISIN